MPLRILGMSPEFITFNPQIKSWTQAIFRGGANFIGNVFEGMMAGAAIGGVVAGGYALFTSGSWAGAGNLTLQFVKSIPKNIASNIIESYMLPGLGLRGVMIAQNVAAGYGETGEMSASQAISDAKDGFFGMEIGTVDSGRKIYNSMRGASTGTATWQDYVGIALNLMPVGKGTRDLLDGKKKSGSAKAEGEAPSKKVDDADSAKPKTKAEGETPSKKAEGDAYEMGYRQDSNPYSNQGKTEGRIKSYIDADGNLIPANKDGVATVQDHIRGSEPRKSDSPYTSFSKDAPSPGKVYGDQTITVDLTRLEADIESGKVKDVEVLRPEQVQAEMQGKVDDAQAKYDKTPSKANEKKLKNAKQYLKNTKRDNEILIKGEIPSEYIEVKPTNEKI